MRRVSQLNKLLVLSFIVFSSFAYSYQLFSYHAPPPEVIKIKTGYPALDSLDLRDNGNHSAKTFKVNAGKTIRWNQNAKEVESITNIYAKAGSQNVFSDPPHREGHSQNWVGTVDPAASGVEDYNIDWTDKSGRLHTYDPRIQIKSR